MEWATRLLNGITVTSRGDLTIFHLPNGKYVLTRWRNGQYDPIGDFPTIEEAKRAAPVAGG